MTVIRSRSRLRQHKNQLVGALRHAVPPGGKDMPLA